MLKKLVTLLAMLGLLLLACDDSPGYLDNSNDFGGCYKLVIVCQGETVFDKCVSEHDSAAPGLLPRLLEEEFEYTLCGENATEKFNFDRACAVAYGELCK